MTFQTNLHENKVLISFFQNVNQFAFSCLSRFITSYDESNSKATMVEPFFESLIPEETDLVLLSGLHMLESQPQEFFSDRLEVIKSGLSNIPASLPVHLELASMVNLQLLNQILNKVCIKQINRLTDIHVYDLIDLKYKFKTFMNNCLTLIHFT